jgi:SLT domain-containing protein
MTPGTFVEHHQPGTSTNIYAPLADIAASMNPILGHYGVNRDGSHLHVKVQQTDPRRPVIDRCAGPTLAG